MENTSQTVVAVDAAVLTVVAVGTEGERRDKGKEVSRDKVIEDCGCSTK